MPDSPRAVGPGSTTHGSEEAAEIDDALFLALSLAYGPSGGLVWGDELSRLMSQEWQPRHPPSSLARLIANREIVCFRWRSTWWIPMAQFRSDDRAVDAAVREVRQALGPRFAGWEVACWLVRRHERLQERRPLDVISHDRCAVVEAARADREGARPPFDVGSVSFT